jgi:hypothetical protein
MSHLTAQKKSSSSLRGRKSEVSSVTPSSTTPSDQKPREGKSAPYTNPRYETILATKGSFMGKSDLGALWIQVKAFAELCLRQNNQSLKIHCFVMICSAKLARVWGGEMKLWLFETFPH